VGERSLRRWLPRVALGSVATVALFRDAWTRELFGTAAFYATLARGIAEGGGWAPITYAGDPYVLKPPLVFWLAATTMEWAGVGVFTATLWSRLFGLASIALTAVLGRRLFGRAAGFYAALIVAVNPIFVTNAATFRLDSALLAGIVLSTIALAAPPRAWRPWAFFGGVALGTLAKGPVGLLPLGLLGLHAAGGGFRAGSWKRWLAASSVLIAPAAWYAGLHVGLGGWATGMLLEDVGRAELAGPGARLRSALETYGVDLLERFLPFTPFVAWGVIRAAVAARGGPDDRHRKVLRLLFAWLVAVLVVLAARETHRERYLVLVLPPLALLGGREVARFARAAIPRWVSVGLIALAVVVAGEALVGSPARPGEDPAAMAAIRGVVEAEWPDPASPVPVLATSTVPPREAGKQWGPYDWIAFHLGRPVRLVEGSPDGRPVLVYLPQDTRIADDPGWRILYRTRYVALVVPVDPPRGGG